ncbi:hypothetical protein LINGRAHAP2_LOCUS23281, partial [Linum grandiflorum]
LLSTVPAKKGVPAVKKVAFRCKTGPIVEVKSKFADDRRLNTIRRYLLDANFHGILDLQIEVINKDLSDFLLCSFDAELGMFNFGKGVTLSIEPRDVTRVYGLLSRKQLPDIAVNTCGYHLVKKFMWCTKTRAKQGEKRNIDLAKLQQTLEVCQDPKAYAKLYILFALGTMLRASNSWKVSLNYAKYLHAEFHEIANYNWGSHIANWLLHRLEEFGTGNKKTYPSGDMNFMVV